jgi:hypothetical protein
MVAIGLYGFFFTLPAAIVLFIITCVARAIPPKNSVSHKKFHRKIIRWIIGIFLLPGVLIGLMIAFSGLKWLVN